MHPTRLTVDANVPYVVRMRIMRELTRRSFDAGMHENPLSRLEHRFLGSTVPLVEDPLMPLALLCGSSTTSKGEVRAIEKKRKKTRLFETTPLALSFPADLSRVFGGTSPFARVSRDDLLISDVVASYPRIDAGAGRLSGLPVLESFTVSYNGVRAAFERGFRNRDVFRNVGLSTTFPLTAIGCSFSNIFEDIGLHHYIIRLEGNSDQTAMLVGQVKDGLADPAYGIRQLVLLNGVLSAADTSFLRAAGLKISYYSSHQNVVPQESIVIGALGTQDIIARLGHTRSILIGETVDTRLTESDRVCAYVRRGPYLMSDLLGIIDLLARP